MEYDMTDNVFRCELMKEPLVPDKNGMLILRDAPGLGIDVKEDVIEKYRVDH